MFEANRRKPTTHNPQKLSSDSDFLPFPWPKDESACILNKRLHKTESCARTREHARCCSSAQDISEYYAML